MKANLLILLTDVAGVYNKHPNEPGAQVNLHRSIVGSKTGDVYDDEVFSFCSPLLSFLHSMLRCFCSFFFFLHFFLFVLSYFSFFLFY